MDEKQAKENLAYIKSIVSDTRVAFYENGIFFIVIGIVLFLGITGTRIAYALNAAEAIKWVWIADYAIMFTLMFIIVSKKKKARTVTTISLKIYISVWYGIGIANLLFGVLIFIDPKIDISIALSLFSIIAGIGYFVSHVVLQNKWMIFLAIGWWTGGVVLYFTSVEIGTILIAIMIAVLEIIPGIVMYSQRNKVITE